MLNPRACWVGVRQRCIPLPWRRYPKLLYGIVLGVAIALVVTTPGWTANLETIQQRGYLVIAVKDNVRPLGFRDETGQLVGLEIDIAHRLAADLLGQADAVRLIPVTNQERLPVVLDGNADLAIAQLTATGSRSRLVNFSRAYYLDGTALITRNPTVQQLSNLRDRPIAVLNRSSAIATVQSLLPTAHLVETASYQSALAAMETGQVDAFAADASVLTGWIQTYPQYRLLPSLLSAEALCIAMPRGVQHDDLRRRVDEAIDSWQQSGWLQARVRYWGLPFSDRER